MNSPANLPSITDVHRSSRLHRLVLAVWIGIGAALGAGSPREVRDRDAEALFAGPPQTFVITVAPKFANQLREDPRSYVPATIQVGTRGFTNVGIHLKGAAGSSRSFDDRPALTLNFDKFVKDQVFSGLDKLHLNNSVQDGTFLSESIASRLYREAGVPTARSGHAFVRLNGRDLGLYVLKEGYDSLFIRRNFPPGTNAPGNLYDGGFLQDVDQGLELDAGKGPTDGSDLRRLRRAAGAPVSRRAAELDRALDVDRFLTFLAIQALTDDWDGYGRNRNNYRLYFDPVSGKAEFIPHGMDQLFREIDSTVDPDWEGFVARRAMELPEFQTRYQARLKELANRNFTVAWLTNHLGMVDERMQTALTGRQPEDRARWANGLRRASSRTIARIRSVRKQLGLPPDPTLVQLTAGSRKPQVLTGWQARPQQGTPVLDTVSEDKRESLHLGAIRAGTVASFRTSRTLSPGEYTLEASIKTRGIAAQSGAPGRGAGIRISGADRQHHLTGSQDWSPTRFEFEIHDDREIEFIVELRADKGEAWFDLSTLRLIPH
ncbi:MAG: CotH kinase family protein [Verrucomicrobiales bacterium]|nr:CotH kinase family protein [Verrucomicrobiales bacterium]